MNNQFNAVIILKVANGYAVELPFFHEQPAGMMDIINDPEQYGKILGEVMKARDRDDNLGVQEPEEKPKPKKQPAVKTAEFTYIFSDLKEALEFVEYKLQH